MGIRVLGLRRALASLRKREGARRAIEGDVARRRELERIPERPSAGIRHHNRGRVDHVTENTRDGHVNRLVLDSAHQGLLKGVGDPESCSSVPCRVHRLSDVNDEPGRSRLDGDDDRHLRVVPEVAVLKGDCVFSLVLHVLLTGRS